MPSGKSTDADRHYMGNATPRHHFCLYRGTWRGATFSTLPCSQRSRWRIAL